MKRLHHSLRTAARIQTELAFAALLIESRGPTQRSCWLWAGQVNANGYGLFSKALAHREVYQRLVGPIPHGLELDHLCSRPRCVNPWHLEPVTHVENLRRGRGFAATNAAKTHCVHGHEFTPENTYVTPKNQRKCRACNRDRMARKKAS